MTNLFQVSHLTVSSQGEGHEGPGRRDVELGLSWSNDRARLSSPTTSASI